MKNLSPKTRVLIVCLILLSTLIALLSSCGAHKPEKDIVGEWGCLTKDGDYEENIGFVFNSDKTFHSYLSYITSEGTYTIGDGTVFLTYDSGRTTELKYKYDGKTFLLKTDSTEWWNLYKK